jgi:hypothetical protein
MENELIKKDSSPASMIRMAVEGKADLTQLRELLSLQKEWEANEAKKAYHLAMSEFKANAPKIDKDRTVAYGNTKYNHASLYNVVDKISAELSKHGLSASWSTKQNGTIAVTCKITHIKGHSEETTITAPSDTSGAKNAIQAIGSTLTYLQRYSLLSLTGLATFDSDDDAQSVTEYISETEQQTLQDKIVASGASVKKFLEYMKVDDLSMIKKEEYKKGIVAIENYSKTKK